LICNAFRQASFQFQVVSPEGIRGVPFSDPIPDRFKGWIYLDLAGAVSGGSPTAATPKGGFFIFLSFLIVPYHSDSRTQGRADQ